MVSMKLSAVQSYGVLKQSISLGKNQNPMSRKSLPLSSFPNDLFVKNSSQVSFTGTSKKENLGDSLAMIGLVGGATLLSITAGVAMAKGEDVDEIFLDNDGYSVNTGEQSVNSDKVIADADDGIFKVEGTGIDIDRVRFQGEGDIFDPENGVYRTADGSVDIDLLNNKYVDTQNGIFVDPEHNVSSLVDSSGEVKHFALPTFGSGYPTNQWADSRWSENQAYWARRDATLQSNDDTKDLFGREITPATDEAGHTYLTTVPSSMPEVFKSFNLSSSVVQDYTQTANSNNFTSYLQENFPNFKGSALSETSPGDDELGEGGNVSDDSDDHLSDHSTLFGGDIDDSGQQDVLEIDIDETGVADYIELGLTPEQAMEDENENGIPDWLEGDLNDNGIPDYQEVDLNKNDIPDWLEGDLNDNGIPDYQEEDADDNGIPDFLEGQ